MQGLAVNVETEIVYPLKGIQTTTKEERIHAYYDAGAGHILLLFVQTVSCWLIPFVPRPCGRFTCVSWERG